MPRTCVRAVVLLVPLLCHATALRAQDSGRVAGRVTDPTGLALPGVTITASGPGQAASARSDADGRYVLTLAPGEYRLTYTIAGFEPRLAILVVRPTAVTTHDVRLELASIPQTVQVAAATDSPADRWPILGEFVIPGPEADPLPDEWSAESAALFAPGVTSAGSSGAISMAGAFSYGNLFLVDGLVATENTGGRSRPFFIQSAVQETRVTSGAVPTEYGRFQGGVVNTITRSGGNSLSGSLRIGLTNDQWRALTPYRGDATLNQRVPTWEGVIGGPLVRNRLFYFGAVQRGSTQQQRTLSYTRGHYLYESRQLKVQAKGTWTPATSQTLRVNYFRVETTRKNASTGTVMDATSLYDVDAPEWLAGVDYQTGFGGRTLMEVRYSARRLATRGVGSSTTSLVAGTPIWDRSRSDARFNSPTGCAVCPGSGDERNNSDVSAKVVVAPGTGWLGSHEFLAGVDLFQDTRQTNAYGSGSGYRVRATRSIVTGGHVYPVFLPDRTTWIYWQPVLTTAEGNDLRTYSAFAADTWRPNRFLTLKGGIRFDLNDARDSVGARAVLDAAWSPRVALSWDPTGRGQWILSGAWSRYVTSINSNVADAASPGGRPATFVYDYLGPAVNQQGTSALVDSPAALRVLFDWFLSGAGTGRATRSAPVIPGVNVRMDPELGPLEARELLAGVARQFGRLGSIRVEGVWRQYLSFYAFRRDKTTGQITTAPGVVRDVALVTNATTDVARRYRAVQIVAAWRPSRGVRASAVYTLASLVGNVDGEDANVGPTMVATLDYPEYRGLAWNAPSGPLAVDRRHRLRVWATWSPRVPGWLGSVSVGLVQRLESGLAWSAVGSINPRAYVANPGYATPPTSVSYYFSPRGAYRTDTLDSTDLSLNWSRPLPGAPRGRWFARAVLMNALNRSAVLRVNRTVLTRNDSTALQAFNPFTQTPIRGVHYEYGVDFGKPVSPFAYQPPREFSVSFGVRY
ncbi:MAG: carboxypeptidase regulatory-like domain-containing protein [Acidobacteriota bacterium]